MFLRLLGGGVIVVGLYAYSAGRITGPGLGICVVSGLALFAVAHADRKRRRRR